MNVTNSSNTAHIRSTVTGQLEAMLENRCECISIITLVYSVQQENVTKYGLINSWVTLLPTVTHCLWFGSEACEGRALPSQQKFV